MVMKLPPSTVEKKTTQQVMMGGGGQEGCFLLELAWERKLKR